MPFCQWPRARPTSLHKFLLALSLVVYLFSAGPLQASILLNLIAPHGLQGTIIETGIHISTDTPLAGFNAEMLLPAGVTVSHLEPGNLLTNSGIFKLSYLENGQSVRIIAYSGGDTITGSGEIVKLFLSIDMAVLALQDLNFSTLNPDPLINSRHAVSNPSGSGSLTHDVQGISFLVYSETSDFDQDEMPDAWEVENNLDPLLDDASADADNDGFTNLDEYQDGTDPNDPNSNANLIFKDSFENETNP